jgi:predicted nucleic acid-binding protein
VGHANLLQQRAPFEGTLSRERRQVTVFTVVALTFSKPAERAAGEDQRRAPDAGRDVVEHDAGAAAQALRREDTTFKLLGGYWSRRVIRRD